MTRWTCACTTPAAAACPGDTTFNDRWPDGSCGCACHIEYESDPESWQPISVERRMSDAELAALIDLEAREDAAEAMLD